VTDELPGASDRLGRARSDPLIHHDLCFGCGQANLFGLQLELQRGGDGVEGRFFVKQDHQGPDGNAHAGVLAAALDEAMAHAAGGPATRLDIQLVAPVPVGTFVSVRARREGDHLVAEATAADGTRFATARSSSA
jgi:acyl-coenzyme A thioesterase PaaI-like protein